MSLVNHAQGALQYLRFLMDKLFSVPHPGSRPSRLQIESSQDEVEVTTTLRQKLPPNMMIWHSQSFGDPYFDLWELLSPLFQSHGFTLWSHKRGDILVQTTFEGHAKAGGYAFHSPGLPFNATSASFPHMNGKQHVARGIDDHDYMITVMTMAGSSDKALQLLRRLSSSMPDIILSNNHILPLFKEIQYEDITFGVFPLVQGDVETCLSLSPEDQTLEDVLYIVLQVLEATVYIHSKNLAHRDLFLDNFLVEWIPLSLETVTCTRPRVYLIDFESAVEFTEDTPSSERLCRDFPFPVDIYRRPKAPELCTDSPLYNPFSLDIWQLAFDFRRCIWNTGFPEVDNLWERMFADDPAARPTAQTALDDLRRFLFATPPQMLHTPRHTEAPPGLYAAQMMPTCTDSNID